MKPTEWRRKTREWAAKVAAERTEAERLDAEEEALVEAENDAAQAQSYLRGVER